MRALCVAIHPSTSLRRQQIRDLREGCRALLLSTDHPTVCARTDLKALALLEVPRCSAIERQRQHVPDRQLDRTLCRSSHHAGIAHQYDAEAAHFARGTRRLRRESISSEL